jgi:hypothetical protein
MRQVTKWMLSKGQGRTLGTYTLLLEALDNEGRVEEADALWEKLLTEHEDATPRIMFTVVIAMFERHNQPKRLLQVNSPFASFCIPQTSVLISLEGFLEGVVHLLLHISFVFVDSVSLKFVV